MMIMMMMITMMMMIMMMMYLTGLQDTEHIDVDIDLSALENR